MSWKDSLPASAKAYIGERQLDEVECIISDFPGVARGKAVPASKFAKQEHFYLPNSIFLQTLTGEWAEAAGEEGWVEPDMTLRPDLDTATAAPWATDATLQVIHDAYDRNGVPVPTAPRNVLKRVVKLFRDKGLEPVVAPEMEFFLVARNTDPAQPIVPMMGRSGRPAAAHQAYSLSAVDEYGPVIDDIYDFAEAQGFEIDGKTQIYFGIGPAIMRLPFSIVSEVVPRLPFSNRTLEFDRRLSLLSELIALSVLGLAAARLLKRAKSLVAKAPEGSAWWFGAFAVVATLGTPLLFFSSRALVYHEAELWGAAAGLAGLLVLEFGAAGEHSAVPEVEVTLVLVHALALDALRPDRVGGRHVHDHAGITRLGEAPFHREAILLIALGGAKEAAGLAGAREDAVLDGPGILAAFREDDPAGGVLAVEEFGLRGRRDGVGGEGVDEGGSQQGGRKGEAGEGHGTTLRFRAVR